MEDQKKLEQLRQALHEWEQACIPKFVEKMPESGTSGFYCPCHGGKYDNLGRRLGGPRPENLHLVPYRLAGQNRLIIGTAEFGGYGENIRKVQELPPVEA